MDTDRPAPDSRRTATSYAILGLLSLGSWTTYELAKQAQRSLNWFWPRAERKLYDEPKRLVKDGLATASKEFTGQRPRTVYGITEAGRAALVEWLDQPSAPRSGEFEAMMKVFFADAGSLDQLQATLAAMEYEASERLGRLAELIQQAATGSVRFERRRHLNAVALRLQFEQEAAVLRWARWARTQAVEWNSASDGGEWDVRAELAQLLAEAVELTRDGVGAVSQVPSATPGP